MATNINKVYLTGNLTQDPELRTTQSGVSVLSLNVAVNDAIKNTETQEYESYANFFKCTVFGKRAESLAEFLKKGIKVAIDGKLRYSSWKDEETDKTRSSVSIIVQNLDVMSRKADSDETVPVQDIDASCYDEDIPF